MRTRNPYSRTRRVRAGVIAGIALFAVAASGCTVATTSSPAASQANPGPGVVSATATTQTSEGGQVTVAVTWDKAQSTPVFRVAMYTHSVNLDSVDLMRTAVLRTNKGIELLPTGWDAPKGGHHRGGILTFPLTTPAGAPVLAEDTRSFELVIRDVAGVPERTFDWTL